MSTDPTKPSAEERAALIVGRLGKLVGMAMNMDGAGAGIALSKQQEQIEKEIRAAEAAAREPLIAENRILRGLVQTNPDWKCPHGETVDNIGKCPSGFPGCACADDRISVLCEDEERIVSGLRAEVERLKENLKTASAQTARRPPLNRNRRDMIEAARAEGRREGLGGGEGDRGYGSELPDRRVARN